MSTISADDNPPKSPEPLFLDYPVAHVLNKSSRRAWVEPWASRYCAAVSDKRYGDAIWARYNMDGRTVDGEYKSLSMIGDGSVKEVSVPVYEMIMDDARGYAKSSPDCYREALLLYNTTSRSDSRRDIIEGLNQIDTGSSLVTWAFSSLRGVFGLN
ncbi:hypothetical protein BO94DRAFT_583011 [Aspergillus sclerotioniger CBS 115572]|uniref:Uncharacterized protein n=1 Tax=Aspergillus sclerotioniger CBS 115572 TaxID=1450535 RepID=A0A317X5M8_9EURO|nr:hypothetical protein BO94DRAFT_583011 [Aspergillus sclerotioniger CBS 115572]PWY93635.1 hypothetical protein BO94DRAFT_583011 [Aspergillus sclerotioniger CBS 115572]